MSEQSFVQQLVQESLPVWEQCLHSEFLERLADGTLDEACFKGYIVEDSLYLREYAKVFAWGHDQGGRYADHPHLLFPAVLRKRE